VDSKPREDRSENKTSEAVRGKGGGGGGRGGGVEGGGVKQ